METLEIILALNPLHSNLSLLEKERLAAQKNQHYQALIQTITSEHILPGVEALY